jgi:hypothetical protein
LEERFGKEIPAMWYVRLGSSFLVLALSGLVLNVGRPAAAPAQEAVTVQGEILDMACYMAKGSRGASHKACAQMCVKRGVPIGVLTDAGELFLLLDDHNNPDPYEAAKKLAGERAEIAGKRFSKQGIASIVVDSAKGL